MENPRKDFLERSRVEDEIGVIFFWREVKRGIEGYRDFDVQIFLEKNK